MKRKEIEKEKGKNPIVNVNESGHVKKLMWTKMCYYRSEREKEILYVNKFDHLI